MSVCLSACVSPYHAILSASFKSFDVSRMRDFLKMQWQIHFSKNHILGQNVQKKIRTATIEHFIKTAFRIDPGLREVPEPENTQIHVFAYFMCFLVRALPKVRDQIRKQFFDKVLYNYCSKFFFEHLGPKMAFQKNYFALYFHKLIWEVGRSTENGYMH